VSTYTSRNYGYILSGSQQYFFHLTNWISLEQPRRGLNVAFELGPSVKAGMPDQAINVTVLTAEQAAASILTGAQEVK
jgi:hypothetical protein